MTVSSVSIPPSLSSASLWLPLVIFQGASHQLLRKLYTAPTTVPMFSMEKAFPVTFGAIFNRDLLGFFEDLKAGHALLLFSLDFLLFFSLFSLSSPPRSSKRLDLLPPSLSPPLLHFGLTDDDNPNSVDAVSQF